MTGPTEATWHKSACINFAYEFITGTALIRF